MSKKILILSLIVIALAALVFFLESPFDDRFSVDESPFYPELKVEEVYAIDIEYFAQGTRFEKDSSGNWLVMEKKSELQKKAAKQVKEKVKPEAGSKNQETEEAVKFPADAEKVKSVMTTFMNLKRGSPFSTNPEKQNLLEISPVGLNATLYDKKGGKLARLFVGKQGPDIFSSFVKDENSNDIYLVETNLQGVLNRTLDDWKKKEEAPSAENQPADLK